MFFSARTFLAARDVIIQAAGALACLVTSVPALADDSSQMREFVARAWGTEAGLPQNTVSNILQTRDGYLWLGTNGGLARFDGVRFKDYGLAEGLPSLPVQALFEDDQGCLWIGTNGGGLSRLHYDDRIETFNAEDGLRDSNVTALAADSSRRLWIGTVNGLSILQDKKIVKEAALAGLDGGLVRALLRDRQDTMWISSSQGLFEFKDGRLTSSVGPPGDEMILAYCLLEDRDGNLWASIGNGKVLCRRNGVWGKYDQTHGLPAPFVTSLAEGADGTIWAGTLDAGLFYFHQGKFHAVAQRDGLLGDDIRALLGDRDGNLWVGTRSSGLNRLARRKVMVCGPEQGLVHNFVRSVAETADGTLWVGTTGGGLYSGGLKEFSRFGDARIKFYTTVESVLGTRDGSLWWGCARALYHWKDGKLAAAYTPAEQPWLGKSQTITALSEDPSGGLWIGTAKGDLMHLRDGQFVPFAGRVAQGSLTSFAQEADGTLWVGSMAGGLSRIRDGVLTNFSIGNGFPCNHIRTLYMDRESTLWVGTGGAGLIRWKNGRSVCFTTRQGMGDDTVSQILEDEDGFLWLGCNRGIFRYRKADFEALAEGRSSFLHARAYGATDGMLSEECASGFSPAGLKMKSGHLCFSTLKGLVVIDPRQQAIDAQPPRVLFEEVMVDRQNQKVISQTGNGDDPVKPPFTLTVAPGSREIDFHYTALNFTDPEKVRFRFRLDPLDSDWVEAGARRVAYYHRTQPGNYLFRVMACNADGVWSEPGASLAVTVNPFFWQTRWFLVLSGLTVFGLLVGTAHAVGRRRLKIRLAQAEIHNAVERERLRISQDMHDDIGGLLTRVSMLSDMGQSQSDVACAQQQFERIGSQVRAAVVALDEIVWATNPKDDNLPRFAEYVGRYADECFEDCTVRCWQEIPTNLPNFPLRADVRHNIFLAIKEALHNVLKHSEASEVWLRLDLSGDVVCLDIEDNGRGLPLVMVTCGNGMNNMRSRLAECGGTVELVSNPGQGVKIRFAFPVPKSI